MAGTAAVAVLALVLAAVWTVRSWAGDGGEPGAKAAPLPAEANGKTVAPAAAPDAPAERYDPDSGAELLGTPAPAWEVERWVRGGPLTLEALRGQVVLVRWWTEECRFCEATLPGLERLRKRYGDDGLVVVGMFHPKPQRDRSNAHILGVAKRLGFEGPIAFDRDWKTLERYWLDGHPERNWTSVSFLIDRDGRFVWVHGGGEYHRTDDPAHARCDVQWNELMESLGRAIATPASPPPTP
jgi:glutathione peroxidase-family protein